MADIEARGLRKAYGSTVALDGIDLSIEPGRIVGLIGQNGAGKSTLLNAIVGLTPFDGHLRLLGRNPWTDRDDLARDVSHIGDVAVLPRWIRVSQAIDFVSGIHPRFHREKVERFLATTTIRPDAKVRELSKGMVTQLHLALVMAIDTRVLVLDEPTLGLDPLYRTQFHDALVSDYLDHRRTVLMATHQVEEVQHLLTDVVFIDRGRILFNRSLEAIESEFQEVFVRPDALDAARALKPIAERQGVGHSVLMFEGVDRRQLATVGDARTPTVAELFTAIMTSRATHQQGVGR